MQVAKEVMSSLIIWEAPKKIDCIDKYRYLIFVKNTRNKKQV